MPVRAPPALAPWQQARRGPDLVLGGVLEGERFVHRLVVRLACYGFRFICGSFADGSFPRAPSILRESHAK